MAKRERETASSPKPSATGLSAGSVSATRRQKWAASPRAATNVCTQKAWRCASISASPSRTASQRASALDPFAARAALRARAVARSGLGIAALAVEETMTLAYRAFVVDHSAQWAAMFERLADPDSLPALVHCTAGKDRTGFASALVLRALGVSHETIVEDYLLSNFYRDDFYRVILRWVPVYSLFRTNPEDLLPLLEARCGISLRVDPDSS